MKVLDHGYLRVVETYGSDERVIEAARMSVDKGFLGWEPGPCGVCQGAQYNDVDGVAITCLTCDGTGKLRGDKHLLKFLWEKKHATPFEMAGLIIEVQAPIFVFREWHRHRTQSYNEMSSRYIPLPDVNYVPTVDRLMRNASGTNKQAGTVKGSGELTRDKARQFRSALEQTYQQAEHMYQCALADGVPKELARVHLPVGRYSRMRAHANLRNWLGFLALRKHPTAQWEIQQYANAVHAALSEAFPRTLELFDAGQS